MRTLTESEEQLIGECMRLAGVRDLEELRDFCKKNTDGVELRLNIEDERIRNVMPVPEGRNREVFVRVVNIFLAHSRETGNYPKMTQSMSRKMLSYKVAEASGVSFRTAKGRIDQLVAVGWLKNNYGNITNPVQHWYECRTEGLAHPGI
jgi:hypothetical protein